MLPPKHLDDRTQRAVLFIGDDAARRKTICNFLAAEGCKCIPASAHEAPLLAARNGYDAILLDVAQSSEFAHQAVFALNKVRAGMAERILVITGPKLRLSELFGAQVVSRELPLPQLWASLQNIFRKQQPSIPAGMHLPRLIFDSLLSPQSQGVRGAQSSARQLAFQHHSTTINLLIKRAEDTHLSMAGQVLDLSMRVVHGLPVLLSHRSATLAQTITSQFGEFSFEIELPDDTGLQIRLAEGSWIYMPLKNLSRKEN